MNKFTLTSLAMALIGIGIVGCTPQARDEYGKAGDSAATAAAQTGKAAATDAKATGEVVKDAAAESKKALDNTAVTARIRTAISAAADIKVKGLNVDTIDNKIILKGTVAGQADKDKIQKLAEGAKPNEFTVDNQLVIGAVN